MKTLTLFILLSCSALSLAQEETGEPATDSVAQTETPAADADTSTTGTAGDEPAADYRASEQISEDLSVSFPVDI